MKLSLFRVYFNIITLLLIVITTSFLNIREAYAEKDGVRSATWHNGPDTDAYRCQVDELEFNPVYGNDINWELANPVCLTYMATTATANFTTHYIANAMCLEFETNALLTASQAAMVGISPAMALAQAKNAAKCFTGDPAMKVRCCSALAISVAGYLSAIAALGIIHAIANDAHNYAKICGTNWNVWMAPKGSNGLPDETKLKEHGSLGDWISSKDSKGRPTGPLTYDNYKGAYSKYLSDKYKLGEIPPKDEVAKIKSEMIAHPDHKRSYMEFQEYRELSYGGIEYESKGVSCKNPDWSEKTQMLVLGYTGGNQRYYMKGPGEAANFACERFLIYTADKDDVTRTLNRNYKAGKMAYDCCVSRSQDTLCMESKTSVSSGDYEFCRLGGPRCKPSNVWYDIYEAKDHPNHICAKTFSVCPFNHLMGGGTEVGDFDKQTGEIKNTCQYLKHCVKVPAKPHIRNSNMTGEYIASSCFDLKGDSQNVYSFNSGILPMNSQHFSAPIAQCFHETLYNIFLHKSGHTRCVDPEEFPEADGTCPGGEVFTKGDDSQGLSFFEKLQDSLRMIVKLTLTLAITAVGYTILMGGQVIARKDLSMFIIKIGLVMYFAVGNAWQTSFFEGVFNASMNIADIVMQIDESETTITNISKANPTVITVSDSSEILDGDEIKITRLEEIPALNNKRFIVSGKSGQTFTLSPAVDGTGFADYENNGGISLEKKLDGCQFPKFNYEDGTTVNPQYPKGMNYLKIWDTLDCKIVRAIGFSPEVSVPNIFLIILAGFFTGGAGLVFLFASLIFLFYLLSIAVRALHMFLLSTISIVILIYISPITITMSLFKRTSEIFTKWWKNLAGFILQPFILFAYLGILISVFDATMSGGITYTGDVLSGPKLMECDSPEGDNSLYCIFGDLGIKTNNIAAVGLGLPVLDVATDGRLKEIVLIVVKSAFLMFIFAQFFGKISSFAASIVGGSELKAQGVDQGKALGAAAGAIRGVQQRGMRAMKKIGGKAARAAGSAAKSLGDKGASASRTGGGTTQSTSDSANVKEPPSGDKK